VEAVLLTADVFLLLAVVVFLRVLVFFLLEVLAVDLVLLLVVFFLRSAFAWWDFCDADVRACSDAWDKGVMDNDVNSKAQSVIETLFIRATEHSSVRQANGHAWV
jgi:hypothetical protein